VKQMVFAVLLAAACKQGKGDRCQINADCASGLVCSAATGTCSDTTTSGIDANVPDGPQQLDAPLPADASPADAPAGG
jgi:hypothetical protein